MDGLVVSRLLQKSGRFAQYYFNTKISKQEKEEEEEEEEEEGIKALNH